jgi:hypothetical protein
MAEILEMEELKRRVTELEQGQTRTETMLGQIQGDLARRDNDHRIQLAGIHDRFDGLQGLLVRLIKASEGENLRCSDCPMRPQPPAAIRQRRS